MDTTTEKTTRKTRSDKLSSEDLAIKNKEKKRRYYLKNQEKIKEENRISAAIYYKENTEILKQKMKSYYINRKEMST